MKKYSSVVFILFFLIGIVPVLSSFIINDSSDSLSSLKFPFKRAGLTERQAAAHLLSRFTFGTTPNQIDEVVKMGLVKWFEQQLAANLPDDSLNVALAPYETLNLNNKQLINTYLNSGQLINLAIKEGVVPKDSALHFEYKNHKAQIDSFMKERGFKQQQEVVRQLIGQKIIRSASTNNQLQEVMTSFWYNHFNVDVTKDNSTNYVICYEKDVIRPNSLGKFEDLLAATAKSPAMLTYLDNFRSVASMNNQGPEVVAKNLKDLYQQQQQMRAKGDTGSKFKDLGNKINYLKNLQGLNENYAREIMELHTLGVDGGYTQTDVTNAAKVLTGWTIFPMNDNQGLQGIQKMIDKVGIEKLTEQGYVHDGDFMFAVNKHDQTEKVVLGNTFPVKGGVDEGKKLITMLAHHNSTAHFICKKLAVRFVSDNPSKDLIEKMATTFLKQDGDIRQVLTTMVASPEFWSKNSLREKIKSPFELTISTIRALNAKVTQPYQLFSWISRMGEKMYHYQAPTGFPDRAQYWINTGSLLNRMNFGLALANQKIPGLTFNLAALNNHHEPESMEAALTTYCKLLLPERDVKETVNRLMPLVNDPQLSNKIAAAGKAVKNEPEHPAMGNDMMMTMMDSGVKNDSKSKDATKKNELNNNKQASLNSMAANNNNMLSQVAGIIIGSPEFQRR